jgi:hypothetical protein
LVSAETLRQIILKTTTYGGCEAKTTLSSWSIRQLSTAPTKWMYALVESN